MKKKSTINKEIYISSMKNYLNTLFDELHSKEVNYAISNSIRLDDDLLPIFYAEVEKEKEEELTRFKSYVWGEYKRCYLEKLELEKTEV